MEGREDTIVRAASVVIVMARLIEGLDRLSKCIQNNVSEQSHLLY